MAALSAWLDCLPEIDAILLSKGENYLKLISSLQIESGTKIKFGKKISKGLIANIYYLTLTTYLEHLF